jgi:hypothetical protein
MSSIFDKKLTDWVMQTYQSLQACKHPSFSTCARVKLRSMLKGTWVLHYFPLGLFKKEGTSHAEDVVRLVENIWSETLSIPTSLVLSLIQK